MSNLNYGFGEDQTKKGGNPFPIACDVDNVEITNCKYSSGTSQTGKEWEAIDVTYTRAGTNLSDKMFAVNPDNVQARSFIPGDTYETALEDKVKTYNTQLKHIATKLGITDQELMKCRTTPFAALAEDYCNLINSHSNGQKLYLKTTLNGGYPKVCRNPNNNIPFLQNMNDGPCELVYNPKELEALEKEMAPKNGVMEGSGSPSSKWLSDSI